MTNLGQGVRSYCTLPLQMQNVLRIYDQNQGGEPCLLKSVSDPYDFDMDPAPDPFRGITITDPDPT